MGFVNFIFELLLELGAELFATTVVGDGTESEKAGRRFALGCLMFIVLGFVIWLVATSR